MHADVFFRELCIKQNTTACGGMQCRYSMHVPVRCALLCKCISLVALLLSSSFLVFDFNYKFCYTMVEVKDNTIVKDGLVCYMFNATSIREKLSKFNSHFSGKYFDIFVISVSETWLNDSVMENEVLTTNQYKVFRRDCDVETVPYKKDSR